MGSAAMQLPLAAVSAVPPKVCFADLRVTDAQEREAVHAALARMMDHGRFLLGPEVGALEERVATYCDRAHCVGVGSGTDALLLSLMALGIGPGRRSHHACLNVDFGVPRDRTLGCGPRGR